DAAAAGEQARMRGLVGQALAAADDDEAVLARLDARARQPLGYARREAERDDHHVGLDHRFAAGDRHRRAATLVVRLAEPGLDHAHAAGMAAVLRLDRQRLAVEQEANAFLARVGHLARRAGHVGLV